MEDAAIHNMTDSMTFAWGLIMIAHLLSAYWIAIGLEYYHFSKTGWIVELVEGGQLNDIELPSLYITSFYFVMTSFSSVGYGDVTGNEPMEYLYQCLVEMLGIGIFGWMTGMIQGVMMRITEADQSTQYQDRIMLWLVALDKVKANPIEKDVFQDVRDYYDAAYKYDTTGIFSNHLF